ncbi:MAG: hypothetical protein FWF15_02885 [Oscillospiraceae bacterium]|nr:hypothetical protein [Oscillospiraceae bacterium]
MKKLFLILTVLFLLTACSAKTPRAKDIDTAFLDLTYEKLEGDLIGGHSGISKIIIKFNGAFDNINIKDFTEMILTRNGIPANSKLKYDGEYYKLDEMTWFYLSFETEIREPGIYDFTGKYKGVEFNNFNRIIVEKTPLTDTPANPDDLYAVSHGGRGDESSIAMIALKFFSFQFSGIQQSFYISDLTDLEFTLNGQKLEFSFIGHVVRYLYVLPNDDFDTHYALNLNEEFSDLGNYKLTGNYKGKPFTMEFTLPFSE